MTYLVILGLLLDAGAQPSAPPVGRVAEISLRAFAKQLVLPAYPAVDVKAERTGVAVAELYLDKQGKVSHVQVLQAPSSTIAESVGDAVVRSVFQATGEWSVPTIVGKLTFYFICDEGHYQVFQAPDAPTNIRGDGVACRPTSGRQKLTDPKRPTGKRTQ